jgi:hypothetical protein
MLRSAFSRSVQSMRIFCSELWQARQTPNSSNPTPSLVAGMQQRRQY